MIKKILFLFTIISLDCCYADEPRMIDTKLFLETTCFQDGIFTGTKDSFYFEEFISNSFFNDPMTCKKDGYKILIHEQPKNKIGVLRTCAMWLLKIAADIDNKHIYTEQINLLLENVKNARESKSEGIGYYKIPSINVTLEEATDYYHKALKNRLRDMSIQELSNSEAATLKNIVYDYCIDNTEAKADKAREYVKSISNNNEKKKDAVDNFLIDLHPGLYELFTGEEYIPPNEIYPR